MTTTPSAAIQSTPPRDLQVRIADAITVFCGSMLFVYVHVVIFGVWIGARGFGHDHYPFNFLTMAVSLEAIFLSTFILISQNRQQAIADANNGQVEDTLLRMVNTVVDDEKLDLANEDLIKELVQRIAVEHVQPMEQQLTEIRASLARLERGAGTAPAA